MERSFYRPRAAGGFDSLPSTASPWGPDSQHGGPPAALLTRAVESLPAAEGRVVGRFTMELLGPVPVGPLAAEAQVVRPGRTVALAEATLVDLQGGRPVARARAWLFPDSETEAGPPDEALAHHPFAGQSHARPEGWGRGYLDSVEWRWIIGAVTEPGPAVVWMRPLVALLPGEDLSPVARLMACVDSASGVSAELDLRRWTFMNTELTVHVLRPPAGEWLCLVARTDIGSGSVGLATSDVYDVRGLVARSAQALLVARR